MGGGVGGRRGGGWWGGCRRGACGRFQPIGRRGGAGDRLAVPLVTVGGDDMHVGDADEAEDMPQIAAREIDLAAERHAARSEDDIGALAPEQPFGTGFGVAEGAARERKSVV